MKIIQVILFFLLFISTNIISSFAQTKSYLNMKEAIELALSKNHLIKAKQYELEKASWDVKRAWSQLFPVLSFNTRYNWIDAQTFAERDFRQYLPPELSEQIPQTVFQESYYSNFDLSVPLFNGVLINGLSVAYEQKSLSKSMNKAQKEEIIFNVISNYLTAIKNKRLLNVQEEFLNLSKLNYEKAHRLFLAGRYSRNDELRLKIDYQQQKSNIASSQAEFRNSILSLGNLLNSELDTSLVLDDKILSPLEIEFQRILKISQDEIFDLINLTEDQLIKANSKLRSLESSKKISRLLYKNSYSSFFPKINLNYSYGWRENNTLKLDDYSPKNLSINLNIPIFTGFQNYTQLKSTFYEYKKNEEEFNDQLLNTKLILNQVVNNIIMIKTQMDLLKTNLEFSKNNYNIVSRKRERKLVSNIEYLDAKLNMQNTEINMISTKYNLITSIAELYYLIGKIETMIY